MDDLATRLGRRLRRRLNQLQERIVEFERDGGFDRLADRVQRVVERGQKQLKEGLDLLSNPEIAQLRRWYAVLRVPYGAPASQVKTAYRQLMREHHPDRHTQDPAREAQATTYSQELTVAYTGLMRWLERGQLGA